MLAARTAATGNVDAGAVVVGAPPLPLAQGKRAAIAFTKLPELIGRVRELERLVATGAVKPEAPVDDGPH